MWLSRQLYPTERKREVVMPTPLARLANRLRLDPRLGANDVQRFPPWQNNRFMLLSGRMIVARLCSRQIGRHIGSSYPRMRVAALMA